MQQIRKVGVLSCAKIAGITYGAMAVLFIPVFLFVAAAGALSGARDAALGGAAMVALAFAMPIIYGLVGFVAGALVAWIYNLVAAKFGGVEIELLPTHTAPMVPPPA